MKISVTWNICSLHKQINNYWNMSIPSLSNTDQLLSKHQSFHSFCFSLRLAACKHSLVIRLVFRSTCPRMVPSHHSQAIEAYQMGQNELTGYSWIARSDAVLWTLLSKSSEIKFVETHLIQYAQHRVSARHSYPFVIALATPPCLLPKADYTPSYNSTLKAYQPPIGRLLKR